MSESVFLVQAINRHRMKVDGKGVTTLVGLFGCPLKCKYCINKNVLSNNQYRKLTPEKLWDELKIDYCYYLSTGGGITFGGGESLLHYEAILEFMKILPEGVTINIETSLNAPLSDEKFEMVARAVLTTGGQLIIDTKSLDADIYHKYTGIKNDRVLARLRILADLDEEQRDRCLIRVPIIPEYKTREQALQDSRQLKEMGFNSIDMFYYVLRDYMMEDK